jgi:Spherulation-specific family 4
MTSRGCLIPAYVPPGAVIDVAELCAWSACPRLIVVNPHNGPGARPRPSYRDAVQAARHAGARVLGYVATGWGERPAADVLRDVERHIWWYRVDGVFLDEAAADAGHLRHYRRLVRRMRWSGRRLVVLNPGTVPDRRYFGFADIVVTFEGRYADHAAALSGTPRWLRNVDPRRIAHLIYGASRDEALAAVRAADRAGYVYATSGTPPNPWRTVPGHLLDQEEALHACS